MQQAPANGPAPNLHAASHLVLLVMASDAHALHHWNQQEWGQTHTRKTTAASLTSELCSPALWQVGTKEKKRKEKEKEKKKEKKKEKEKEKEKRKKKNLRLSASI